MPAFKLTLTFLGSARALTRSDEGPFLENGAARTVIPPM
jgi:hypothetical protein